jgi:hypothetical protein
MGKAARRRGGPLRVAASLAIAHSRFWPVASLSATHRHVRSWGQIGSALRTLKTALMTLDRRTARTGECLLQGPCPETNIVDCE